ncbi:MAG: DUF3768 domain-containing protein [Deltaproteobacteria bacterium]|nr:DUF3768 domain-containing protein [Deltaproteobacteria bacterium]NNK07180.1 DUF3768 domain-containing protein [Myxococcales bacterium]MBT8464155.1 DUF3768 domain-containing protein [Deltaproteobacteria bacterium]MBT8481571.1 DUF3768 domain-containing protein [Deltaproteobacteria bacterium]NNK43866.1 DUF3768 domain-containing protein [Myxococcales bacterium]
MSPTEKIAHLNDKARKGLLPGSTKVLLTREVTALPEDVLERLVGAVKTFDAFSEENDPYGERDFGAVELEGERYFWKIDYYDRSLRFGAEDPSDTTETVRVLTLMHASEY